MLGLEPEARRNRLTFVRPVLPEWLPWVEVLDREGDAEVVVRR